MRRRSLLGLAVALSLAVPACARSGAGGGASCPSPTPKNAVNLVDFAYDPSCVGARAGTTLTLTDTGRAPHTYTVPGTSLNVKLDPGRTETAPLTGVAPGTYTVICEFHPQMRGALVVG